jgi:hypothetical protein
MKVVGISDIGLVREKNEDAFLIDEDQGFFLVCDGMGGHRGGQVASHKITIDVENCKQCGKCKIGDLKKLAAQNKCKLKVVTGGTLARKAIKEQHPGAVIAIACERDLSLGIQDISAIPVLGILNRRPHGPCMNTDVDMNRVQTALNFFSQGG